MSWGALGTPRPGCSKAALKEPGERQEQRDHRRGNPPGIHRSIPTRSRPAPPRGAPGIGDGPSIALPAEFQGFPRHDSGRLQGEDEGAAPRLPVLLLFPVGSPEQAHLHLRRHGGPDLVRHLRHGSDRAQQTDLGPILRGHPEASVLRRNSGIQRFPAPAPRPFPGGDPEEAGSSGGEEKVPGGGAAEAPGGKAGARAGSDPEGHRGEQQLHQDGQGEAGAEDGIQQGKPRGPSGGHVGAPPGEGQTRGRSEEKQGAQGRSLQVKRRCWD
ncbi:stathmin-4 isoform X2 [Aphelocoma coerulescens]|uniref:stathmin-4 isoform X2 n=1 Tax=Aphelocoma coerulescens TaxID=39617 RepID=UPI0036048E45